MYRRGLKKLVGKPIRIRPPVKRVLDGVRLPSVDDQWLVSPPQRAGSACHLSLLGGGHSFDLGRDAVFEFFGPDLLVLRAQLTLTRWHVLVEPLPHSAGAAARYATPEYPSWEAWQAAGFPGSA